MFSFGLEVDLVMDMSPEVSDRVTPVSPARCEFKSA